MATVDVAEYLNLASVARRAPNGHLWTTYDVEADTLYINFKRPSRATDGELTDDDVIVRYEGAAVVGLTILRASTR